MLDAALPKAGQPLLDWQTVVLGGGAVTGASERGHWPMKRVAEIIGVEADLKTGWTRALELASAKAEDEKVPAPTRYDALRLLACEPWEKRGGQLTRYLAKGTHEELQSGAIAGAGDIDSPAATEALLSALPHLTGDNRNAALDALLRNRNRAEALARAIEAGKVDRAWLGGERAKKLAELRKGP
jgi:hypothetical protein